MTRAKLATALIDSSSEGALLVDGDGIIHLVNPAAATLFGHSMNKLVGASIDLLVPPEFLESHQSGRQKYSQSPAARSMTTALELFAQHASGYMFPVEISLSPCVIEGQRFTVSWVRDISERRESAAEISRLEDRERIARDLHDKVIQRIFAAGMHLQAVLNVAQPRAVADRIAATIDELDATIRELRTTIFSIGHYGELRNLVAQISELVYERGRTLEFEPRLRMAGNVNELSELVADQLVATLTEGLSNVLRHAKASFVDIQIDCFESNLALIITDDGVGIPDEPKPSGGLANMMWRAAELGGTCTISPNNPTGTRIEWIVPI